MFELTAAVALLALFAGGYNHWQMHQLRKKYSLFFDGAEPTQLNAQLTKYNSDVHTALQKLDDLAAFSGKLHQTSQLAITKIGLVRFNPFSDTGGDQSFCLAVLNAHQDGFVLSSIHTRTGARIYAKAIAHAKSEHPLSDEETEALNQALKITNKK